MTTTHADTCSRMLTNVVSRRIALRGIGGTGLAAAVGFAAVRAIPGFGSANRVSAAEGADPAAIIAAYVAAANAHNLDSILSFYTDDAAHVFLPTPDGSAGVCLGKDQFRMWYEQSIKDGDQIEVVADSLKVEGDRATFAVRIASSPWKELGLEALEATEEAVIADGQITSHVVMLTPDSVRKLLVARGTIPTSPAGGESDLSAHRTHAVR